MGEEKNGGGGGEGEGIVDKNALYPHWMGFLGTGDGVVGGKRNGAL